MANEKRLIPLNKRIVYAGDVFNSLMSEKGWSATEASDFVKEFRIVDAVEVVRCKDCKMAYIYPCEEDSQKLSCGKWTNWRVVEQNHFCSYGERKDNANSN